MREPHPEIYGSLEFVEDMKDRTKAFAIRIIRAFNALPKTDAARTIGRQFLRSGTSVGANYRAVCRARSKKEFIAKLGIVIEEADETAFWLDVLADANIVSRPRITPLLQEAHELLAIFSASYHPANRTPPPPTQPPPPPRPIDLLPQSSIDSFPPH